MFEGEEFEIFPFHVMCVFIVSILIKCHIELWELFSVLQSLGPFAIILIMKRVLLSVCVTA